MKDERHVRQRRAAGARWRPAAILLAAVLVFLSLPLAGKASEVINLDTKCSLTVFPGKQELWNDMGGASLQIDLYRVADAIPVSGYDTYDWKNTQPFASVTIPRDFENANWKKAAQDAAAIVLGVPRPNETEWDPSNQVSKVKESGVYVQNQGDVVVGHLVSDPENVSDLRATFANLDPGLYLILAHGSNVENYAAVAESEDTESSGDIVTVANSRGNRYTFFPELVSIPTKAKNEDGVQNTANRSPWLYDSSVFLKPAQTPRAGSLRIYKELETYNQREKTNEEGVTRRVLDPATFIFDVKVYDSKADYDAGNATPVYHDKVSIVFDAYGEKSVLIGNLPVDSYAVVTEEYSGGIYTTDTVKETTIEANEEMPVNFKNDYDDRHGGGGSVTNKFGYGTKDGWTWNQVTDDTEESVNNPIKQKGNQ